ncbi:unnamed protein product [Penicillium discolor]
MVRSYVLLGFLTALCQPAYGLVFSDRIKQVVEGQSLYLLHDVEDPAFVSFSDQQLPGTKGWTFDTEGLSDDEAVITPLDSDRTLICNEAGPCILDESGSKHIYVIARVEGAIFTFQDAISNLYVSRAPDFTLELTPDISESSYFELEKLKGDE